MMVKCKICGNKIDRDIAYKVSKTNEETKKITNSYYCSEDEYNKDKENKGLWREILISVDVVLGYTCISKTKVNMIKDIEENYTRRQLYNCLNKNSEEIKRYLDEKDIYDEYGKLCYIFACIKNKINDDSKYGIKYISDESFVNDLIFETDEDIVKRLNEDKSKNKTLTINDILNKIDNVKGGNYE